MRVIKKISKEEFKKFLFESLDVNDPGIYEEMNSDHPVGVFQLSANTALKFSKQIKPSNFQELDACNALSRPGSSFGLPFYIEGKENGKRLYDNDKIHEVFSDTYGVPIFQEQIMSAFVKLGGFSPEEANNIRSLMKKLSRPKKDQKDIDNWNQQIERFKSNAEKLGVSKEEVDALTEDLVKFSSYSFCRAHSTSYTMIAAITLYLAKYFRKYFYSALLTYAMTKDEADIMNTVLAIRENEIDLVKPDINLSKEHISVIDGKIVFGLADIKGISDKPCGKIFECRPYTSFKDFLIRTRSREVSSSVISGLISVGAFDEFEPNRNVLNVAFKSFWENKKTTKVEEKLSALWDKCYENAKAIPGLEMTTEKYISMEKEYYGCSIFTSPFDKNVMSALSRMKRLGVIHYSFKDVSDKEKKTPAVVKSIRRLNDKNGKEMAFVELEDVNGDNLKIPIFASFWKYVGEFFSQDSIMLINLYRKEDDQIMFGQKAWTQDEIKILSFIKKLR